MHQDTGQIRHRWRLTLVLGAILLTVLLLVAALLGHKHNTSVKQANSHESVSYDKNSNTTVRTINGEHGNTGVSENAPVLIGTAELINSGLTDDQLSGLETAFYRYTSSNNLATKQISITAGSSQTKEINQGTPNEATQLTFTVVLDNKNKLSAAVQYTGLDDIDLTLYSSAGALLFDSGVIDGSSISGD